MNHIYLFGDREPNTDSIASVIGYAEFKSRGTRQVHPRPRGERTRSPVHARTVQHPGPYLYPPVQPRLSDITYKRILVSLECICG